MKVLSACCMVLLLSSLWCISELKAQQKKPQLSLTVNSKKAKGGSWISAKVTIPSTRSVPVSITLSYSGAGASNLLLPPTQVVIPAGSQQALFDLDLGDISGADKLLHLSASQTEYMTSDSVSVTLVKDIKPAKTLKISADNNLTLGDRRVTIKVKIPDANRESRPIQVMLYYTGDGVPFVQGHRKPTSIQILPGYDQAEFDIYINEIPNGLDKTLTISASANGYSQYSNSLDLKLKAKEIDSPDGTLTLPPLPKLKIQNDRVVPYLMQTTQSKSSKALQGVWINCRLKVNFFNRHYDYYSPHQVYLWIPLKDSPLRYYAFAQYDIADAAIAGHNELITTSRARKYDPVLTSITKTKYDEVLTSSEVVLAPDFVNKVRSASMTGSGLSPIDQVADFLGFSNTLTSSIGTDFSDISLLGPSQAGYRRLFAQFIPRVSYYLGDSTGALSNHSDILKHIDIKSVEKYVNDLLWNEENLKNYMKQPYWQTVSKVNSIDLLQLSKDIKESKTSFASFGISNSPKCVTFANYQLALFHYVLDYNDPSKYNVQVDLPIVEEAHDPVIHLYAPTLKDTNQVSLLSLTSTQTDIEAGGALSVTLNFASEIDGDKPVRVKLSYQGANAHFLKGPQLLELNMDGQMASSLSKTFTIQAPNNYNLSDHQMIKVVAQILSADNSILKCELPIRMKSDLYTIEEVAGNELYFPTIPEIMVKNNEVVLSTREKTVSISNLGPEVLFAECKLKATFVKNGQTVQRYISPRGLHQYGIEAKPMYFLVPIKKLNPFRYRAVCEYKLGTKDILQYNESMSTQQAYNNRVSYQNSTSKFDEQFQREETSHGSGSENTSSNSITSLDELGMGDAAGSTMGVSQNFTFPAYGIPFSADFWTNSSRNSHRNHTKSNSTFNSSTARSWMDTRFGFQKGTRGSQTFTDSEGSDFSAQHTSNIHKMGPLMPYFIKAYAFVQPSVTYSLIDSDKGGSVVSSNVIDEYIDYDAIDFLGNEKITSLKNYVKSLMRPPAGGQVNQGLNAYMEKYQQQVMMVNASLTRTYELAKADRSLEGYTLKDIEVDSYSFNIKDFKAPYGAVFLCKTLPTDCSVMKEAPVITMGSGRPHFTWKLAPSVTESRLQIQRKGGAWSRADLVVDQIISRKRAQDQPEQPSCDDLTTAYAYDAEYEVRVDVKCGTSGQWLNVYSPVASFTPRPKLEVKNIRGEMDSGGFYNITWDPIPGAQGYYVKYANEGQSIEASRRDINAFGQTHPFMQLRNNGPNGASYRHQSATDFFVVISALKNNVIGEETVSEVFRICPSVIEQPRVSINSKLNPVFSWKATPNTTAIEIWIRKQGDSDWNKYSPIGCRKQLGLPFPSELEDDITDYDRTAKYEFRVHNYCELFGVSLIGSITGAISGANYTFDNVPFEFPIDAAPNCGITGTLSGEVDSEGGWTLEWDEGLAPIAYKIEIKEKKKKLSVRRKVNVKSFIVPFVESSEDGLQERYFSRDELKLSPGDYQARVLVRCRGQRSTWKEHCPWESFSYGEHLLGNIDGEISSGSNDVVSNQKAGFTDHQADVILQNGLSSSIVNSVASMGTTLSSFRSKPENEVSSLVPQLNIAPIPVENDLNFNITGLNGVIKHVLINLYNVDKGLIHTQTRSYLQNKEWLSGPYITEGYYVLEVILDDRIRLTRKFYKK